MTIVTRMNARVSAMPWLMPQPTKTGDSVGAIVAAPNPAEMKPASVTPTCPAARNRLGFAVRVSSRAPRRLSVGESLHLGLAQRHEGQFGHREEAAEKHEEQHHEDVDP